MANFKNMGMNLLRSSLKKNGAKRDDVDLDWYEPVSKDEKAKLYVKIKEDVPFDLDDLEEDLNRGGAQIERSAGNELEILLYEGFGAFYNAWKRRNNNGKKHVKGDK